MCDVADIGWWQEDGKESAAFLSHFEHLDSQPGGGQVGWKRRPPPQLAKKLLRVARSNLSYYGNVIQVQV